MQQQTKKILLKVVEQKFITACGEARSYAVWVNGRPKRVFYSRGDLEAFKRILKDE